MKVGFVGLGIMGRPMAHNLRKGGHQLFVYGKRTVPSEIREGATVCDTLKAVAEQADVVIIMVPDTPDVQNVLFSPDGVAAGLKPGKAVGDMSSISPIETKVFAAEIVQKGCDYVDAPVSGGEVGAKAASLTIMVGGSEAAFNRVKPLFELMGKNITLVGDVGAGQTTKVANQIIVALTIEAVGEALLFASRAGGERWIHFAGASQEFASPRILDILSEGMIKRPFDPGFRISLITASHRFDARQAVASSLSLPNTATTQE